jgi:hypothetical protein
MNTEEKTRSIFGRQAVMTWSIPVLAGFSDEGRFPSVDPEAFENILSRRSLTEPLSLRASTSEIKRAAGQTLVRVAPLILDEGHDLFAVGGECERQSLSIFLEKAGQALQHDYPLDVAINVGRKWRNIEIGIGLGE